MTQTQNSPCNGTHGAPVDFNFLFFVLVSVVLAYLFLSQAFAGQKSARVVFLDDRHMEQIRVTPGRGTILNFPSKPGKGILGNHGVFAIEYVENDLAIAVIKPQAASNLFVYLNGRRFAFDLVTVASGGDEMVLVRDYTEEREAPRPPQGGSK